MRSRSPPSPRRGRSGGPMGDAVTIGRLRVTMALGGVFCSTRSDGRDPDDFIALHEVAHALDLGLTTAEPYAVDRALRSLPLRSRYAAEVTAMAAAFVVLARVGVATHWTPAGIAREVVIAARGHAIRGTPVPWRSASTAAAIRQAMTGARAQALADRIVAWGESAEVPGA